MGYFNKGIVIDFASFNSWISLLSNAPFRFSPELLGVQASSAFVWLIMEVLAVLLSLYLVTVNTDLTTIDVSVPAALLQDRCKIHSWWWLMLFSVLIMTETSNSGGRRE